MMKTLKQLLILAIATLSFMHTTRASEITTADWSGTYKTDFGEIILLQKGKHVVGTYRELGTIRSLAKTRNTLYVEFDNNGKIGYAKWTKTGNKFSGPWGWTNKLEQGVWDGEKIRDAAQNYIKGLWNTTYGDVEFINSKTGMMAGHYNANGGMIWGKMNHVTHIFEGNYRRKLGAKTETCWFYFYNERFEGKFNNRPRGSWNGWRPGKNPNTNTSTAVTTADQMKIKITLNSFKLNQADGVRGKEQGKLDIRVKFINKNNSAPVDHRSIDVVACNSRGCPLFLTGPGYTLKEGIAINSNDYAQFNYVPSDFKECLMVFGYKEFKTINPQEIASFRKINIPEIIKYLKGTTNANQYPLKPGYDGRRSVPNSTDTFWLNEVGGRRIVQGYGDIIEKGRGKIRFGYHYTIELINE